jgi:hypothetical protein
MKVYQVVVAKATECSFWGSCFAFEDLDGNEINVTVTDKLVHRLAERLATKSAELRNEVAEAARLAKEENDEIII